MPGPNKIPEGDLLKDYDREDVFAKKIGRDQRTVQRWRKLKIGPPFTMVGLTPYYSHAGQIDWLARGGTLGKEIKKSKQRKRRA
jgi:hypothetical protein